MPSRTTEPRTYEPRRAVLAFGDRLIALSSVCYTKRRPQVAPRRAHRARSTGRYEASIDVVLPVDNSALEPERLATWDRVLG